MANCASAGPRLPVTRCSGTGATGPASLRGSLTVTHPEVSRFFMTVREAVELVLEASATPPSEDDGADDGGSRGKIFVLDMGEPVKIADLARQMIRLAGLRPERDIAISYIG